jgi:hypothetical protein
MSLYVAEYRIYIEIDHVRDARELREKVENQAAWILAAPMPEGVRPIRTEATLRPAYDAERRKPIFFKAKLHMLVEGEKQARTLCKAGATWWKTTLNPEKVTCKTCLERMKK